MHNRLCMIISRDDMYYQSLLTHGSGTKVKGLSNGTHGQWSLFVEYYYRVGDDNYMFTMHKDNMRRLSMFIVHQTSYDDNYHTLQHHLKIITLASFLSLCIHVIVMVICRRPFKYSSMECDYSDA